VIGADDTPKLVWDLVENLKSNNYDVRPAPPARSDSFRACADAGRMDGWLSRPGPMWFGPGPMWLGPGQMWRGSRRATSALDGRTAASPPAGLVRPNSHEHQRARKAGPRSIAGTGASRLHRSAAAMGPRRAVGGPRERTCDLSSAGAVAVLRCARNGLSHCGVVGRADGDRRPSQAEAVQGASALLMCCCEHYQISMNCKLEALYPSFS